MQTSGVSDTGIYNPREVAEIRGAVEAVCAELGIEHSDQVSRELVARRIMRSWEQGRRTPLWLVSAGLDYS